MQLMKKLSLGESQQFQKLKLFSSDRKTYQACLGYYLSYKQQTGYVFMKEMQNLQEDKIGIALKCAFFMAEKSQATFNLKGQKVKAIGLSLSELLKSHKLDDIMIMLKDFSKKVKIPDEEAEADINAIVKEISFLITFYNKFDKTILKLELKERVGQSFGYTKTFVSFVWLLYAEAKNRVLHRSLDLIENTCMLAQTIAFMLFYAWDYIRPIALMRGDKKLTDQSSPKEVSMAIKEKVLQIFLIKNLDTYKSIALSFQEYFQEMVKSKLIKVGSKKIDFLSPELLNTNYKKLDYSFQKSLNSYDIDERIFHKERAMNLTPSKFTPFSRQGYANKGNKPKLGGRLIEKQNFESRRVLTYEMIDRQQPMQRNVPMAQMKLPKSVIQTPSTVKVPLICSTPITAGMQMYNYLTEKVRRVQKKFQFDGEVDAIVTRVMSKDKKDGERAGRIEKKKMITYLHCYLFEEYIRAHPVENTQSVSMAFLILSTELVFFVSNISLTFEEIEEEIDTQILDEWKVCDYLLKFDKSMPQPLKLHLIDLQVSIISHKIWKDPELVELLQLCSNGQDTGSESVDRCFRTVLVQMGVQISQMSKALRLQEKLAEGVFDTMKQLLLNQIDILQNRHLDQLIICAFYVNCRVGQVDVKFNEIKEKYEDANPYNKALHQELIFKVYMDDEPPVDIIRFYNSMFIVRMKKFTKLLQEKGQGNVYQGHTNCRRNAVLQSPLKAIIPKEINNRPQKKFLGAKPNMTPQTHLLYAYNESPILKNQFHHNFKAARKTIDFDDENLGRKYQTEMESNTDTNHVPGNTVTSDYVSRKFMKKMGQTPTPTNGSNPIKHSPTMLQKNVQSPISLSQLHSNLNMNMNGHQNLNPNLNINIDHRSELNMNSDHHPIIPMRVTPINQQEVPLSFNQEITKKYTHAKNSSGGINFAAFNVRRS